MINFRTTAKPNVDRTPAMVYNKQASFYGAYVPVAQLDRALDSDSKGHRFESCRAYHKPPVFSTDTGGFY